ncbi:AraC family transcriptional regulator [Aquabacterium sp.]|uniref:helix-turn-helix domain-containing protein n=1 Tax=Aquabacterium sp. TaxID=1872578 RepID=UPI00248706E0|nr:AraC family transcriptional regulator [Aquabacterium sp.]MDI1260203.1 AraC family transcriptional regulator ligand-binding domain-containing protein [Aquabacterium sp.]
MPTSDRTLKSLTFPIQYLEIAESLARELGMDVELIYQHCGIDLPRPFMPWQSINGKQLKLALAYFLSLCPPGKLPLVTLMEHFPLTAHGPLGMLALTSANLDEALQGVMRYATLVMPACELHRMEFKGDIHTIIECRHDFGEVDAFFTEMVVVAPLKILSFLSRPFTGGTVYLKHAALGNQADYEAAFGLKFVFNARQNKIVLPKVDMSIALISRSKASHLLMKATLEQQDRSHARLKPLTGEIKRHLHAAMVQQRLLSADTLAQTLALSSRTLSRKLKEEGSTLPQLRTEVGIEYAEVLLLETSKTISQVASAAGFANAPAFARAFKRAHGQTPSDWRAGLGQAEVAIPQESASSISVKG